MNRMFAYSLVAVIAVFLFSAWAYPLLSENIAVHWNAEGAPDGFGGKQTVFLVPALALAILLLMWFIPSLDPLKKNIDKFRGAYNKFILVMVLFLGYLSVLMTAFNLGWVKDFIGSLLPAFAVLFYFVGVLLSHAKQSWFIGIRTPWTMSSEYSWNKTHELGAKMFKSGAIAFLVISFLVPQAAFWGLIGLAIAFSLALVILSYFYWKEDKRGVKVKPSKRRKR
ncbi:MAG: SdpI family protein [Candidatus Micrarchaeota archaeon]